VTKRRLYLAGGALALVAIGVATWHIMAVVGLKHVTLPLVRPAAAAPGTYSGEVRYGLYRTAVDVQIAAGRFASIELTANPPDPYAQKARALVPLLVKAQSLDVEAITGATCSSNAIKLAVARALMGTGALTP